MKNSKKLDKQYEKKRQERLAKVEEQIRRDSLHNPLLKPAGEIPEYYKYWIEGAKLVAVLPALNADNEKSQPYYSVGSLLNNGGEERERISPVFMYINQEWVDVEASAKKRFFTFDSEFDKLYSYEKKPHSQQYHFVKKTTFEDMKKHIMDNPVVLFFYGCDDGHVGRRFKDEKEAFDYLQLLEVFEEVFEDNELQYHN